MQSSKREFGSVLRLECEKMSFFFPSLSLSFSKGLSCRPDGKIAFRLKSQPALYANHQDRQPILYIKGPRKQVGV